MSQEIPQFKTGAYRCVVRHHETIFYKKISNAFYGWMYAFYPHIMQRNFGFWHFPKLRHKMHIFGVAGT